MSMLVKWGGRAVTAPSRGGAGSRRPPFNGPPDTGGFEEGISSLAGSKSYRRGLITRLRLLADAAFFARWRL